MHIQESVRCDLCRKHTLVRSSSFHSDHSIQHSSSSKLCDGISDSPKPLQYELASETAHEQPQDGSTAGITEWAGAITTLPDQQVTDDEGGLAKNVTSYMQP
jgi:hypothetical protein